MNRAALIVLIGLCACKKHETPRVDTTAQTAAADSSIVASPSPTSSDPVVASAAPSATPSAVASVESFGMIGLLNAAGDAGLAPWGREDSLGNDPLAARGNMWGDAIGDSFGKGGLGLTGIGDGGGGRGEGIGIGSIGHGSGSGMGYGSGHGRMAGTHSGNVARVRQGSTTVNGRLPPEVIQRIVRQNFGRFRLCYENGLVANPKLAGTVATKFTIDTTGAVTGVTRDASTTLPDAAVVSCVTRAFTNLSFPQPEGGIVVVVYPLIFEPPDAP